MNHIRGLAELCKSNKNNSNVKKVDQLKIDHRMQDREQSDLVGKRGNECVRARKIFGVKINQTKFWRFFLAARAVFIFFLLILFQSRRPRCRSQR